MNLEHAFEEYKKNGFALIENVLTVSEIENLFQECSKIVKDMILPKHCSVFHTENNQARDDYFMNSGDKISYFFEKDAVDEKGNLVTKKEKALNKIGHALHWLNPSFKEVTFSQKIKDIIQYFGYQEPVVVQSMFIFKHAKIGGEVLPHQDSTFLYTEPPSAIGLWFPLVDVSLENGCLWFLPGSHTGEIYQRYVRNPEKTAPALLQGEMPSFEKALYIPVVAKKGDCVVIHGSIVHKSENNLSDKSRPVYTFHIVEKKGITYSKENWLQPSEALPFPNLFLEK